MSEKPRKNAARPRRVGQFAFGDGGLIVERFALKNGLRVLLLADDSAPVLSYHTWFRVGSKHEQPGKTGLAHLFEHLMFNETKHVPRGQLDRMIESAGGETNAATWVDWTHYHSELPSSELPLIVRLEADRMQNLVLRKPQVVSEKEVVANERRYRVDDDIEGQVSETLYATAFTRHPYHWPTIGWMDDIQGFTPKDCEQFYENYYAPNNATLVIVGDVDKAAALELIQKHYGKIPAARLPRYAPAREPTQRRERSVQLELPTPAPKLALGYRAPSFRDRDYPALALANDVLFGGRSSRLVARLFRDEELERLCKKPVTRAELEKVKNRMELGFLQGLETASGKAEQIGFFETVIGDGGALFTRLEEMRAVTARDIQNVARRYLDARRRTRITVVPETGNAEEQPEAAQ